MPLYIKNVIKTNEHRSFLIHQAGETEHNKLIIKKLKHWHHI
jgi:hypothetical protein